MLRNRNGLIKILVMLALAAMMTAPLAAQDETPPPDSTPERVPPDAQFQLPITEDVSYIIQPRDTLDGIAAAFDVSVACVREVNSLRPADLIYPDKPLIISVACPPYDGVLPVMALREDAPGRVIVDGTYIAQQNDTLDSIGQRFNISVQALLAANDLNYGRLLRVGDTLIIPEDAPAYGVYPALEDDEALAGRLAVFGDDAEQYVVQPNDTLDTIGQRLDVSTVELLQVNGLRRGRDLRIGQVLIIPADATPYGAFPALTDAQNEALLSRLEDGEIAGETYTVQPNDTLDTIAQTFNVSVVSLRVANEINAARDLMPGRVLVIPEDAPAYGAFPALDQPAGTGTRAVTGGKPYVIQPGDTLDGIAARHNVETLCLVEANAIKNAKLIQPGQTVAIPSDCLPYSGFDVVGSPEASDD